MEVSLDGRPLGSGLWNNQQGAFDLALPAVSVAGLTAMLEPIMIVMLAVIVGTIVIALFMPLISIIGGLQAQT